MNPAYRMHYRTTLNRGLAYAESCFETWRVVHDDVFLIDKHQQRLQQAMRLLGWDIPLPLIQTWFEQANATAMQQTDDALIRMTISAGEAAWGLLPKALENLHIDVQIMPAVQRDPCQLQCVEWMFSREEKQAKLTADYAMILRAMQQWKSHLNIGQQPLICQHGDIMHALTANILIYRQGQWWTPQGAGILHGIIAGFLSEQGLLKESICPTAWLHDCEVMACCNSGVFIQPIHSINGRKLNVAHPALHGLYAALTHEKGVKL